MHVVSLTKSVSMGGSLGELPAGEWLMNDRNAFEIGMLAERGRADINKWNNERIWRFLKSSSEETRAEYESIKHVLIIRSGAIGDLLFLTPCFRELGKRFPNATITLCAFKRHHETFRHLHGVRWEEYPIRKVHAEKYDVIFPLEDVIETACDKHATDAFAEALGVTVSDYKPVYIVEEKERLWAEFKFPRNDRPRLAIHPRASTRNRDYPWPLWNQVIVKLIERGWEIFLLGGKGQIPELGSGAPAYLTDCSDLTFRESAALLSTCDAFCGVDSSFVNLCPALDVPAVGLYGAFPWQARTSKAPLTKALSGVGECAPCHWLSSAGRHFPPNQPCSKNGYCHVLASISPDRVVSKVDALKPTDKHGIL